MNLSFDKRPWIYGLVAAVGIWCAFGCAHQAMAAELEEKRMIVIEIERNLPDDRSFLIKREFNDLEDLLMWFENKVDSDGCDPYVDKVIMYPKGQ